MPEKGKGEKWCVPLIDNLKGGGGNESESKGVCTPNPVTCCTSNKKSLHAWHGECTNNTVDRAIAMGVGKG